VNLKGVTNPPKETEASKDVHPPDDSIRLGSLQEILNGLMFVTSPMELQLTGESICKNNFDTGVKEGQKVVKLPINIKELAEGSYLYRMYLHLLNKQKYNVIEGPKYTPRLKTQNATETYMKGLFLPLLSGSGEKTIGLEDDIKNKGYLWAIMTILSTKRGVDSSLLKNRGLKHPLLVILGDMQGKVHPAEKKILDMVIYSLRMYEMHPKDNINDFLISKEEIIKSKGLVFNIDNQILSSNELNYIKSYMELKKVKAECPDIFSELMVFEWIDTLQMKIATRQKELRDIKRLVEETISSRLSALYEFHKKNRTKNYQSTKIKTLIEMCEFTRVYGQFNPTKLLALQRLPVLPSFAACPATNEPFISALENGEELLKKLQNASEVASLYSEYTGVYLRKLDSE
jgi:hypothetical protein